MDTRRFTSTASVILTAALLCSLGVAMSLTATAALAVTPPAVEDESVLVVSSTSATLQATINPQGAETTYRFEYGPSEAYGSSIPLPDGDLGSGSSGVTVTAHPQGLSPHTTYHYRVLAVAAAGGGTVAGNDATFTTQPAGGGSSLPDGRQWELVSPSNKHGAAIEPILEAGLIQAAATGGAMSYIAGSPTELQPDGNAGYAQVLSRRGSSGWSSRDIATPHVAAVGLPRREYSFFSEDLSLGVVQPVGPFTQLSPESSERTVYLRHDFTCEEAPSTCYQPLVSDVNVPPGTKFGGDNSNISSSEVVFEGATPDLSHVIVKSQPPLTLGSSETGSLYEWSATDPTPRLVSPMPADESGLGGEAILGNARENSARNAISTDGSRVIFTAAGRLYMHDAPTGETVRIDKPRVNLPSWTGSQEAWFEIASSNGSKVFFLDAEKLTENAVGWAGEERDLYEFDADDNTLSDLTIDGNAGESARVQGVIGASEDGSSVYLVANGVLTTAKNDDGESAAPGADNLYLLRQSGSQWSTTFIATLEKEDFHSWVASLPNQTARVSPGGRYLSFMSERGLTGYDNRDANSGARDEEVYLYDSQLGRVSCASCDPTNARPIGAFSSLGHELLSDISLVWRERWLAADVPSWTPYEVTKARYQSRYLSDSGRLFFNSVGPLVSKDVNGIEDVYEYEPQGIGNCTPSSPTYSGISGGCVNLISGGTSAGESAFLDASATGDDVFILSPDRLSGKDEDTAIDVYDAHVCSASSPCISEPVAAPPCETSDSCKVAPSPQPTVFGSPASATFAGTGNASSSAPKVAVKAKSRPTTRAQRLARALRSCKERPKRKRAACERRARKRYGAKQVHRPNTKGRGSK